ncbi:MAG: hypothetical protein ACXVCK_08280 [Bdellovibrionota bacterium]
MDKIFSSTEIVIGSEPAGPCEKGQIFEIIPQDEATPTAFAEVERFEKGLGCVAKVTSHPKSPLVRVGDSTKPVDLHRGGQGIPARYDLIREGHRHYSSRYKPLVYGGLLFGHTAATLDQGEFLVGVSPFMYGITQEFQLDTTWSRLLEKAGDLGAKYRFYKNEDMKLTGYLQGTKYFNTGKSSWNAELMFDNGSNGRSLSHTRLLFSSKVPEQLVLVDSAKRKDITVELSSVNEWLLSSWHRILFGPKFVAGDTYDLGFLFSMIFIFDHFHAAVNLNVNSIRQFDFKGYKQAVGADMYWRF